MFDDLNDLKLDYILLDQIYINFYSRVINERFYVMKRIERKVSYNFILRGFNQEQLSCFRSISNILSQEWMKSNLTSNLNKIRDTSKYFNLTDELLYPQKNFILMTAIALLSTLIMIGIVWQMACMKKFDFASSFYDRAGIKAAKSNKFNDLDRVSSLNEPCNEMDFGKNTIGSILNSVTNKTLFQDQLIYGKPNLPPSGQMRNVVGQPLCLMPLYGGVDQHRMIKFNPLVHHQLRSASNDTKQNLVNELVMNRKTLAEVVKSPPNNEEEMATKFGTSNNYYTANDLNQPNSNYNGLEDIVEERSDSVRFAGLNNGDSKSHPVQRRYSQSSYPIYSKVKVTNANANFQATNENRLSSGSFNSLDSSAQLSKEKANLSTFQAAANDYNAKINRLDLYNQSNLNNNAIFNSQQYKFRKFASNQVFQTSNAAILLAPSSPGPHHQSIYQSQESNTDDNIDNFMASIQVETNNSNNNNDNEKNKSTNVPSITVTMANDSMAAAGQQLKQDKNLLTTVKMPPYQTATASIGSMNNPQTSYIKELPRNDTFYLTEFSSVKL